MISNMNKIIEGLWLGNYNSANDTISLKKNGITHILTVAGMLEPMNSHVKIQNLFLISPDVDVYMETH